MIVLVTLQGAMWFSDNQRQPVHFEKLKVKLGLLKQPSGPGGPAGQGEERARFLTGQQGYRSVLNTNTQLQTN